MDNELIKKKNLRSVIPNLRKYLLNKIRITSSKPYKIYDEYSKKKTKCASIHTYMYVY